MLASLANFRANHQKETVYPSWNDSEVHLVDLGHPFILPEDRVDNSIHIERGSFAIITGANMAGKSTFLRSLGVNLVLAFAGSAVLAREATLYPIQLFTSMRTSDSLQSQQSYFYAELLRLSHLVDRVQNGQELFVILDEILKGTNV